MPACRHVGKYRTQRAPTWPNHCNAIRNHTRMRTANHVYTQTCLSRLSWFNVHLFKTSFTAGDQQYTLLTYQRSHTGFTRAALVIKSSRDWPKTVVSKPWPVDQIQRPRFLSSQWLELTIPPWSKDLATPTVKQCCCSQLILDSVARVGRAPSVLGVADRGSIWGL